MRPHLHPAWRDLRNRQRAALVMLAGVPLPVVAAAALPSWAGNPVPGRILVSAWWTATLAAIAWFAAFRCPFCGRHFHWTWLVSNPFARHCLHCGFEKLRDPDAGRAYVSHR